MSAFLILILLVITLIGFYSIMKPFSMVMYHLSDDAPYAAYTNEVDCKGGSGYWRNGACRALPDETSRSLVVKVRYYWLMAGIIFIIGLLIWLILSSLRKDPFMYQGGFS
jgi:glucan phosphoethanolaminetransferase (alkaline phosphatase superfamily)